MTTSQPRKQRKRQANRPMHHRQKAVRAHLSEELREEYGRRSLSLKSGDKVEVTRGSFKGTRGEIKKVDIKNGKITIDGVQRQKPDGTEADVHIHPSNIKIVDAVIDDEKRADIIERAGGKAEIVERKEEENAAEEEESGEEGVKCPVCDETFPTNNDVNVHVTEEHKEYAR